MKSLVAVVSIAAVVLLAVACGKANDAGQSEDVSQELEVLAERWEMVVAKVIFRGSLPGEDETATFTLYLGATTDGPTTAEEVEGEEPSAEEAGDLLGLAGKPLRLDAALRQEEGNVLILTGDTIYSCNRAERRCTGAQPFSLIIWLPLFQGPETFVSFGESVKRSSRVIAGQDASCFSVRGGAELEVCYAEDAIPLAYEYSIDDSSLRMEATSFSREVSDSDFELPYAVGSTSFDLSDFLQEVYTILLEDFVDLEAVHAIRPSDFDHPDELDPELRTLIAINGLLQALGDPHTVYIDPESYALGIDSETFEGIGVVVEQDAITGEIVIVMPFRDSPAEKAGILASDIVRSVDGESTDGWDVAQALQRFRGPEGTQVVLGIEHSDGSRVEVTITRGTFEIPTVFTPDIEDAAGNPVNDLAYIELQQFTDQAVRDLRTELERVDQEGYSGIILDLRRNPGGGWETTIQTADMFLNDGIILTEVGREGQESVTHANPSGLATEIPIVLLVGPGTADGSEVLACALRDNGRATLVGEQTFGKGSVNHLRELSDGGALYVTIARWECPNGEQIEAVGILPDIEVVITEDDILADRDVQLFAAIQYLRN